MNSVQTVTICDSALNRFYMLWRHRNRIIIIIIIIIATCKRDSNSGDELFIMIRTKAFEATL